MNCLSDAVRNRLPINHPSGSMTLAQERAYALAEQFADVTPEIYVLPETSRLTSVAKTSLNSAIEHGTTRKILTR